MSAPCKTPQEDEDTRLSVQETSGSTVKPFGGEFPVLQMVITLSQLGKSLYRGESSDILHCRMVDGTRVVIKKRPRSQTTSSRSEKEILCKLTHRGIVGVKWYHEDHKFSYLVLDPVESSLTEHIHKIGVDLKNVTFQVLESLNFIHQQNYVHGDVTCRNVRVDGEGQPRWIGFTCSAELKAADGGKMEDETRRAGELAYSILSAGHSYTGHNTSRDVGDLEWDFITWMTERKKSLEEALDHPVFWNKNRELRFLEAGDNLDHEDRKKLNIPFWDVRGQFWTFEAPPLPLPPCR